MSFEDFFKSANSLLDSTNNMLRLNSGKELIRAAQEEYKTTKRIVIIGTVVIIAVCIGITYLRFRVFGG